MITLNPLPMVGEFEVFDGKKLLGKVVKVNVRGFDKWRHFDGRETFDTPAAAVMDKPAQPVKVKAQRFAVR